MSGNRPIFIVVVVVFLAVLDGARHPGFKFWKGRESQVAPPQSTCQRLGVPISQSGSWESYIDLWDQRCFLSPEYACERKPGASAYNTLCCAHNVEILNIKFEISASELVVLTPVAEGLLRESGQTRTHRCRDHWQRPERQQQKPGPHWQPPSTVTATAPTSHGTVPQQ